MGAEGSRADQERQLNQQRIAKTLTRHVMDFWNEIDELLRIKHTESLKSKQKV
jgi:hypothetical protein